MTTFERSMQPLSVFEHAGRTAFTMQILKVNNPYQKTDANGVAEPSALAWDRGYQAASDEAFQKEHPARPVVARKPSPSFRRPPQQHTRNVRPANHPRWKGGPMAEVKRGK